MAAEALLERDTVALWREYDRTRDVGIRNSLVLQNLGLVYRLANQHAPLAAESLEDLIQEGCLGLIRAVERFQPEYGVQFSTYAYPVISGAIKNYLRSRRRLLGKMGARNPQAEDEAAEPGLPIPTGEELVAPGDLEFLSDTSEEDLADRVLTRLSTKALLARLPTVERRIVTHFFYDDLSQREIGRRLARSNSRISRLLRRALGRLRKVLVEAQREEMPALAASQPHLLRVAALMDTETGLFGPAYLRRCLAREIKRARALGAPLSLALFRPSPVPARDTPQVLVRTARYIYRNVRVLDHIFRAGRTDLALIFSLPAAETAGICKRLQQNGLAVRLHHAIRSFPQDAGSASDLLAAARADLGQP